MSKHRTAEEIEAAKKVVWSNSKKVCTRCNNLVGNYVDNGMAVYCMECLAFFSNKHLDIIRDLDQQLQAETQRADKAQEMVLAYSEIMHEFFLQKPPLGTNFYAFMSNLEAKSKELCSESKAVAQAFQQKLCDEIVGKIEAEQNTYTNKEKFGDFIQVDMTFDKAIDIVKSVLK